MTPGHLATSSVRVTQDERLMAKRKFLWKPDTGAVQPGLRAWSETRSAFSWKSVETSYSPHNDPDTLGQMLLCLALPFWVWGSSYP